MHFWARKGNAVENECEYDFSVFQNTYSLPLDEVEDKTREQILLIATIHFARSGYASVSMRDIARIVGIRPSTLYQHFESKETLWRTVIEHISKLYMCYFEQLEREIAQAATFEQVLEIIFEEPKKMRNIFTCYAFSLIQTEQFRDEHAKRVFCETFLDYSIETLQKCFDRCIEQNLVGRFDTKTVAATIMNCVLVEIEVSVQKCNSGRSFANLEEPHTMLGGLQRFILQAVAPKSRALRNG